MTSALKLFLVLVLSLTLYVAPAMDSLAKVVCEPFDEKNFSPVEYAGRQSAAEDCAKHFPALDASESVYKDGRDARVKALVGAPDGSNNGSTEYLMDFSQIEDLGMTPEELKVVRDSGFAAGVYETEDTIYLAFRGSEKKLNDWYNNGQRVLGLKEHSVQYEAAITVARAFKNLFDGKGKKIVLTGHSLGGGLAVHAATATGLEAQVFNSDGVTQEEYDRIKREGKDKKIKNFYSPDNILHMPENMSTDGAFGGAKNFIKGRFRQVGDLQYVLPTETCNSDLSLIESYKKSGAKAAGKQLLTAVGRSIVKNPKRLARLDSPLTILGVAGAVATEYLADQKDVVEIIHSAENLRRDIQACAANGEQKPAKVQEQASAEQPANQSNRQKGGGGKLMRPPKIKYDCQFCK